jgi:hypothetical protein
MAMKIGHRPRVFNCELIESDTLVLLLQPEYAVLQQSQQTDEHKQDHGQRSP